MANVATPYDLPFEVHHPTGPLFASGTDVRFEIELAGSASPAAVEALQGFVVAVFNLASTGALAGPTLPPWTSKFSDHTAATATGPATVAWVFKECMADETALLVPLHLLLDLQTRHPVRRVVVSSPHPGSTQRLIRNPALGSPYPGVYARLPFAWHVSDDVMDTPTALVRFQNAPSETAREEITNSLLTWAAAAAMGCYPVAPQPPADCGIAVDPDLEFVQDELTWSFTNYYAHPDSLFGLVNALGALSPLVPIVEVTVT